MEEELVISSATEYLDLNCSYMMSLGMSLHDYWHGYVENDAYYIEAEQHRLHRDNVLAHRAGMYVQSAVAVIASNILRKKGDTSPIAEYPREPYPITQKELIEANKKAERRIEKKESNHIQDMQTYMRGMCR